MYTSQVLLVEDNRMEGRILSKCIEQLGLRTIGPATTAGDALYHFMNTLPAMAIINVDLNGRTNGIEVARQLQRIRTLPIIFISAMDNQETVARMWSVKPLVVLAKPLNLQLLQRIITAVLHEPISQSIY